jgi:hypothetical protein
MKLQEKSIGISVYQDVLDGKKFIQELEKECLRGAGTFWEKSLIGANGEVNDYRTSDSCDLQWIMNPNKTHHLYDMFRNDIYLPLQDCFLDYSAYFMAKSGYHEPMQMLKYENGAGYRTHLDAGRGFNRLFSLVAVLENTSSGGMLEFPFHKVEIEATPGSVVLFPSGLTYDHQAHPVNDGTKYSLVTWFS